MNTQQSKTEKKTRPEWSESDSQKIREIVVDLATLKDRPNFKAIQTAAFPEHALVYVRQQFARVSRELAETNPDVKESLEKARAYKKEVLAQAKRAKQAAKPQATKPRPKLSKPKPKSKSPPSYVEHNVRVLDEEIQLLKERMKRKDDTIQALKKSLAVVQGSAQSGRGRGAPRGRASS